VNGPKTPFARGSLEFERFAFFSDAVFVIALTLLVVGIAVPKVSDSDSSADMWQALVGLRHEVLSFFIGFAVIGRYWLAHHRFVSMLAAVDSGLLIVNIAYLAVVAIWPLEVLLDPLSPQVAGVWPSG